MNVFKNMNNSGDLSRGTKKSLATKKLLLNTAIRLFKANGYEKTTMRQIAREADMSLGSTYYYFTNKEEIVFFLYQLSLEKTLIYGGKIFEKKKPLEEKVSEFFMTKFGELAPHRKFLKVLSKNSFDPTHPTSPFNQKNKAIRSDVIKLFDESLTKESLKVSKVLRPLVGSMIWYLQMALLVYWLYDTSKSQANTEKLTKKILSLFFLFLGLTAMPFTTIFNKKLVEIFQVIEEVYASK